MQVSEAVEQYRYAIAHLSPQYQKWAIGKLKMFAAWCDENNLALEQVKVHEIRKYIDYVRTRPNQSKGRETKQLSSYTVHGHARAVRAFLNWCTQEDDLEDLVSEKTTKKIKMPKIEQKVIEIFTDAQIKAFFVACDREYTKELAIRDKAILSVLLDTGVRADELCTLKLEHLHLDRDDPYLKVMGKGRKEREIGFGNKTRLAIARYLRIRKPQSQVKTDVVFLSKFNQPLTVSGLDQLIYRLADWARVEGVRASCHTWRHTFAVNYLKNGGDLYILSRLMGHTSIAVTTVYLKALQAQDARKTGNSSVLDNM